MTRVEEVPHLRSLFRQFGCDEVKKLNLVEVIRDIALCYLPSHADISKGEKYAAQLLAYCTKAFEENAVSAQLEQWILDAYMCLDVDAVEKAVAPLNVDREKLAATVKKLREVIKSHTKNINN